MWEPSSLLHRNILRARENGHTLWHFPCCWLSWPFSPGACSLQQGMSPSGWLVWHSASLLIQLHATGKILTSLRFNMSICSIDGYYHLFHKVPIRIKCGNIYKMLLARGTLPSFSEVPVLPCWFQPEGYGSHASLPSAPLVPFHCVHDIRD